MLPKRLMACAALVRRGAKVCDVGTDHALLPCYLAKEGISPAVIASDVNEKPLLGAARTILQEGCTQTVTTRLSDGLAAISPEEADDVIVAGMGGELIARIVLSADWCRNEQKRFILQPMTQAPILRTALCAAGFSLLDETTVEENGHFYTILWVQYTGNCEELTTLQSWAGAHAAHPTGESAAYLRHQQQRVQKIAEGMAKAAHPKTQEMEELADGLGRLWKEGEG